MINRPPGTLGDVGLVVEQGGARSCGVGVSSGGLARPLLTQAFGNALINFKSSTSPLWPLLETDVRLRGRGGGG